MMRRRSTQDAKKLNAAMPKRKLSPVRILNGSRSAPLPSNQSLHFRRIKGIMKISTLDESLHSTYGSVSSADGREGKRKIKIQFNNIEVREYARTVGDNPSVSSGPPITISWEYDPNTTILSVEEYEKCRPTRRTQSEMVLPRSLRTEMLRKEWGCSQRQIADAVRSGIRAKSQRRTTLGNLGKTDKVEEMIEGATKKLLKTLFLRKSSSKKAQELDDEVQKVDQQRAQIILEQTMDGEYSDDSELSNVWKAELLPDDSEMDNSSGRAHLSSAVKTIRAKIEPDVIPEVDDKQPLNSSQIEAASINVNESYYGSQEGGRPAFTQSTGESAIQAKPEETNRTLPTVAKPIIVATEPEDEEDDNFQNRSPPASPVSGNRIQVNCIEC